MEKEPVFFKGAESIVSQCDFLGEPAVEKNRIPKLYRDPVLDQRLRFVRTRLEARLLGKAKEFGVLCPLVFHVGKYGIVMQRLDGNMLHELMQAKTFGDKELEAIFFASGALLAKIHGAGIAHGDYTPANVLVNSEKNCYAIDFGLGKFSSRDEDKATDILSFLKATGNLKSTDKKLANKFKEGYLSATSTEKKAGTKNGGKAGTKEKISEKRKRLILLAEDIDRRSRYIERTG